MGGSDAEVGDVARNFAFVTNGHVGCGKSSAGLEVGEGGGNRFGGRGGGGSFTLGRRRRRRPAYWRLWRSGEYGRWEGGGGIEGAGPARDCEKVPGGGGEAFGDERGKLCGADGGGLFASVALVFAAGAGGAGGG